MSKARIHWISGPLLRAQSEQPFGLHEAVRVGAGGVLGEVRQEPQLQLAPVRADEDVPGGGHERLADGRRQRSVLDRALRQGFFLRGTVR